MLATDNFSTVLTRNLRNPRDYAPLRGRGGGRVLNFSSTDGSKVFGDELSQTRIYYVICVTYKFCLRSKSEREKKTITIIFLVVVVFLTNDQGSVSFFS